LADGLGGCSCDLDQRSCGDVFSTYLGQLPNAFLLSLMKSETARTQALRQQVYAQAFGVANP